MLKKTVMKTETEVEEKSKSRENNIVLGQYPAMMLTNFDRPKCSDCFNWTRVFTNFLESCFHR